MREHRFKTKDGRDILVRPAEIRDAPALNKIYADTIAERKYLPELFVSLSLDEWREWLAKVNQNREVILVAEVDKQVVGHVSLQPEEWQTSQHVCILGIIVKKGFRNIGIGKALILAAIDAALIVGYKKITLSVFANNSRAIALYKKIGFEQVGCRRKQFYMNHEYIDEVLMELFIAPL